MSSNQKFDNGLLRSPSINIPTVKPIQTKEYETKQSRYDVVSKLPPR